MNEMSLRNNKNPKINDRKRNVVKKSRNKGSNLDKERMNKMGKKAREDDNEDLDSKKDKKSRGKDANQNKGRRNKKDRKKSEDDDDEIDSRKSKKPRGKDSKGDKRRNSKMGDKKNSKKGKAQVGKCPLDKLPRSLKRIEKIKDRLEDDNLNSRVREKMENQLQQLGNLFFDR